MPNHIAGVIVARIAKLSARYLRISCTVIRLRPVKMPLLAQPGADMFVDLGFRMAWVGAISAVAVAKSKKGVR